MTSVFSISVFLPPSNNAYEYHPLYCKVSDKETWWNLSAVELVGDAALGYWGTADLLTSVFFITHFFPPKNNAYEYYSLCNKASDRETWWKLSAVDLVCDAAMVSLLRNYW